MTIEVFHFTFRFNLGKIGESMISVGLHFTV